MTVEFRSTHTPTEARDCPICLEKLENDLVSHDFSEKVKHIFHESCIKSWTGKNPTCPFCQVKVSSINGVSVETPALKKEMGQESWMAPVAGLLLLGMAFISGSIVNAIQSSLCQVSYC